MRLFVDKMAAEISETQENIIIINMEYQFKKKKSPPPHLIALIFQNICWSTLQSTYILPFILFFHYYILNNNNDTPSYSF